MKQKPLKKAVEGSTKGYYLSEIIMLTEDALNAGQKETNANKAEPSQP